MSKLLTIGILFFLLYLLQFQVYKRLWHRHLTVSIAFTRDHIFQGEQGELKEIVENKKRLPLSMLKVKFRTDRHLDFDQGKGSRTTDQFYRNDIFRVSGGERVTRTLKFRGARRGYYTVDDVTLVAADLLLASSFVSELSAKAAIYVYPRLYDSREFRQSLTRLNGEILSKRHLLEDPFEYRGIREYQPCDDIRSVNWKATAKTGDLMVNQKNYTSLKSVRIFFDVQDDHILKMEDCVEASLSITAGLAACFLAQGIQVSCHGNGMDILTGKHVSIPPKAGDGQQDAILRALARVDLEREPISFSEAFEERLFTQAGGAITCFVSPGGSDDFPELLERFGRAGNDYIWFYPLIGGKEPELPSSVAPCVRFLHLNL